MEIRKTETQHYSVIDMNYKRILEKEIDDNYAEKCSGAYARSRSVWLEKEKKYILFSKYRKKTKQQIIRLTR